MYLTDGDEPATTSPTGGTAGMHVSRRAVGEVLADLVAADGGGRCVTVSGAVASPGSRTEHLSGSHLGPASGGGRPS
ncbi:hypothetical protein [Geodermatophilus sp. SYSU D00710]